MSWVYALLALVVLFIAGIVGLKWDEHKQYLRGYAERGALADQQLKDLEAQDKAQVDALQRRAERAEEQYNEAKTAVSDYIAAHPGAPVQLCRSPQTAPLGGRLHAGGSAAGTGTAVSGGSGNAPVHGPDDSVGGGGARDLGPLLRDFASASQDFADSLRECVGELPAS